MQDLTTFDPSWNLDIPAGTLIIRADIAFVRRPGPGGYAAIIESSDVREMTLIRGALPDTTTTALITELLYHLSHEIKDFRTVVLVRNQIVYDLLQTALKPYRMIRLLGHMPLAVADASRHAAVMAERSDHTRKPSYERIAISKLRDEDEFKAGHDAETVQDALRKMARAIPPEALDNPKIAKQAQSVLNGIGKAARHLLGQQLQKLTFADIPRDKTKE